MGEPLTLGDQEDPGDASQLKTLVTLHYVWAALRLICGCGMAVGMGLFGQFLATEMKKLPPDPNRAPPPAELIEMIYGAVGVVGGLFEIVCAILAFVTARRIAARRSWTFCFVTSVVQCLQIPFGTALGIFTILVLQRPAVKARFERNAANGDHRP